MYTPTKAQQAMKQSAIAGSITALAAIVGGTYQYALGNGLNIPALLLFLAPFVVGQALTLWHTLASSPQFPQALADTALELPQEIRELPELVKSAHQKLDQLFATQHTHATPPTVIGQAAPSVQPAPAATPAYSNLFPVTSNATATQAAQVPQQPFPPLNRWGTAEVPTPQG